MWGAHIVGAFLIGWLVKLYTAWTRHRPRFSYGTMVVVSPEQWGWPAHSLEKVPRTPVLRGPMPMQKTSMNRQSRLRHTQGLIIGVNLIQIWETCVVQSGFRIGRLRQSPSLELFVERQIYRMSQFQNILKLAPPRALHTIAFFNFTASPDQEFLCAMPFTPEAQSNHLRHLCSSSWRNGTIESMWQNVWPLRRCFKLQCECEKIVSALCGIDFSKILMPPVCIFSPSRSGYQGSSFRRLVSEYHSQFPNLSFRIPLPVSESRFPNTTRQFPNTTVTG